jgi:MFS family permease
MISFGPRSSLGFFLTPLSETNHWGRDVFALAVAIQNLLWGIGQPFAGAIADRFGTNRVLGVGAILYTLGLVIMAHSSTPGELYLSAGVLIGLGLSGCAFTIVLGAFGKLLPEKWRSIAFGAGTAAGSFGQFLYSPIAVALMDKFGWQETLLIFAGVTLVDSAIIPCSRDASDCCWAISPGRTNAVGTPGFRGSIRPSQLYPARARLLHLRLSTRIHHRALALVPDRPRPVG